MLTRSLALQLAFAGLAALLLGVATLAPQKHKPKAIEVSSAAELVRLLRKPGYGDALAGNAPVPRLLVATLPRDLAAVAAPAERKALFLGAMLPLVLTVNEMVAGDRAQLLAVAAQLAEGRMPTGEQADWLAALMRRYRVPQNGEPAQDIAELLLRVDVVPPSMALAQAALESGWGTSRLARDGNALFGERTWTEPGLEPLTPAPGGRHRAKSFEQLLDAVDSYVRNLNSHPAYADFRRERAQRRAAGEEPQGVHLVRYLTRYSELGAEYTRKVGALIRANALERFDRSALSPAGRI